jgi:multidrug transporter EmrE-like cation transporter
MWLINQLNKLPVIVLLIISAAFVTLGDFLAKSWSLQHSRWGLFVLAIATYATGSTFYVPSLLREGLATTAITWDIMATAGFLIVAFVIFKETLTGWQYIGLFLGLVAIFFLQLGK